MQIRRLFNIRRRIRTSFYLLYNKVYFRLSGVRVGDSVKCSGKIYVSCHPNGGGIFIGDRTTIFSGDNIIPLLRNVTASIVAGEHATISIGNHCGLSNPCIWAEKSITIEDNVLIGANCCIMDSDFHSINYNERVVAKASEGAKRLPVVICEGAWLGCDVKVFKGVTIGNHAVIGGGSVVLNDIPANCVAAGNPCKVIRYLDR